MRQTSFKIVRHIYGTPHSKIARHVTYLSKLLGGPFDVFFILVTKSEVCPLVTMLGSQCKKVNSKQF